MSKDCKITTWKKNNRNSNINKSEIFHLRNSKATESNIASANKTTSCQCSGKRGRKDIAISLICMMSIGEAVVALLLKHYHCKTDSQS